MSSVPSCVALGLSPRHFAPTTVRLATAAHEAWFNARRDACLADIARAVAAIDGVDALVNGDEKKAPKQPRSGRVASGEATVEYHVRPSPEPPYSYLVAGPDGRYEDLHYAGFYLDATVAPVGDETNEEEEETGGSNRRGETTTAGKTSTTAQRQRRQGHLQSPPRSRRRRA